MPVAIVAEGGSASLQETYDTLARTYALKLGGQKEDGGKPQYEVQVHPNMVEALEWLVGFEGGAIVFLSGEQLPAAEEVCRRYGAHFKVIVLATSLQETDPQDGKVVVIPKAGEEVRKLLMALK